MFKVPTLKVDGTFSYVHDGSETTEDRFTYMASDGVNMSELVTVTIVITPVNDAPVAVADALTVDQGGIATALTSGSSVLGNDSDAEGAALTAAVVEQPKHGTLILNSDGTFTYVHDGSQNLVDSFSYKVSDGTAESDAVQVSVQVNEPEGTNLPDDQFLYFPLIN